MPCLREVRVTARVTVDISKAKVTLTGASFTYNGKAKKPVKSVALGKKALKAGTDYDVAYSGNVNAGTAKAKATGKGAYAGSKSVERRTNYDGTKRAVRA